MFNINLLIYAISTNLKFRHSTLVTDLIIKTTAVIFLQ